MSDKFSKEYLESKIQEHTSQPQMDRETGYGNYWHIVEKPFLGMRFLDKNSCVIAIDRYLEALDEIERLNRLYETILKSRDDAEEDSDSLHKENATLRGLIGEIKDSINMNAGAREISIFDDWLSRTEEVLK